mmetsp:Transcript_69507/g.201387  ORF Transcript_69507/g.201387 Transcript_69507/m.201387 type:complete len:123 (-) Transcript_69507:276-644(-)
MCEEPPVPPLRALLLVVALLPAAPLEVVLMLLALRTLPFAAPLTPRLPSLMYETSEFSLRVIMCSLMVWVLRGLECPAPLRLPSLATELIELSLLVESRGSVSEWLLRMLECEAAAPMPSLR